jgi:bacterial/archaeal transporter family protein
MVDLIGSLLTINAIFTWAISSLVYKFGLGKTDPKGNLLFRLVIVSILTFIISLLFSSYAFLLTFNNREMINYLIACAISGVSVTIGDLLYFFSLKNIDASRAYPLTQLSLVFVYPLAFIFFGERITLSILIGGALILSSVIFLSSKDKPEEAKLIDAPIKQEVGDQQSNNTNNKTTPETLIFGVLEAIGTALCWAIAIVSFNQARSISNDVFTTNFFRISFGTVFIAVLGIFQRDYYSGYFKINRKNLKYYFYIGIAGFLSLGLADAFFYKAAEINGLVWTSTLTANTPMVQQILTIFILKEKFRKKFLVAIGLIILGNYIIIFF